MAGPTSGATAVSNFADIDVAFPLPDHRKSGTHFGAARLPTSPPPSDSLWTLNDVASFLSVSRRTAQALVIRDDFPTRVVLGKRTHRWIPEDIRHWARARRGEVPVRHVDALA